MKLRDIEKAEIDDVKSKKTFQKHHLAPAE
jgi:hypothetical protein